MMVIQSKFIFTLEVLRVNQAGLCHSFHIAFLTVSDKFYDTIIMFNIRRVFFV